MQQYAGIYLLQNYSTCFGVYRTHHNNNLPPPWPIGHVGRRLLLRYYDLYQRLQLQFYLLLMMGAMDTRNM